MKPLFVSLFAAFAAASHLDDTNGVFTNYSFDQIKFKTKTDCQLDTYPEVSNPFLLTPSDPQIPRWKCCLVP